MHISEKIERQETEILCLSALMFEQIDAGGACSW
jgi:hypothetical protein